jgi:uncharacterized protein
MLPAWISEKDGGVIIRVKVKPRASRERIEGEGPEGLVVRLTAPPVDNAANEALVGLLAKTLGVAKSAATVVSGGKSRSKTVRVEGVSVQQAILKLTPPREE